MKERKLEHDWFPEPLPNNVFLGERNWLYSSFAFRHYRSQQPVGVETGHDTGLYNGTFFDLGPNAEVRIGNYCTLVGAIICSDRRIVIQDYVFIAHEVVLADSFVATPPTSPQTRKKAQTSESSPSSIVIGENAWIGARAILLGGACIGEGAIVGACSVVSQTVPPYTIVAGNPARIIRTLDRGNSNHD
ncbi:acyltransferase [Leptolyngbya sp. FACHB-17]|uniref:acyltransferase n=1 Tax=unclassified Leptolyngbya TaxID=2650499 RepID=UPI00168132DC|nr:acyltransferase [Leptolyngbya sp. FACHB-17]MBD2079355.1 acyltransferase [Leptolyngbya sp. FACHB-17]